MNFNLHIAQQLNIKTTQVDAVLQLLAEGSTIPFIARYRKDKTGDLDEVQIQQIETTNNLLKEFAERKAFIEKTITEQGKMTEDLQKKIDAALTLSTLEDIYLPYKPKRKTKAQTARENGLEPLATLILANNEVNLIEEATTFITELIKTAEMALQGARDIIAELVNEDATVRAKLRMFFEKQATLQSKLIADKESEAAKYKDYFEFNEPIHKIPSHRTLAIFRGFLEGFLRIAIAPQEELALELIEENFIKGYSSACTPEIKRAIKDSYRRLLQPSLETECRANLKVTAEDDAITVFAENLRQLLLSAPVGSKKILAIDPGYRTGCKVVCLNEQGDLLHNDLIYVHENNRLKEASSKIKNLVATHGIEVIAIGDGTAGRETEKFIKDLQLGLPVYLVNEDGASIYSASEIAREEFGDYDITVRGSVSIGRRLMDPLAELVKIDAKSIGVGQYQHDVNQFKLKERLDATVLSCVNKVGVNLNTASKHLLAYVSGIGTSIADNIVKYRNENGKFINRKQLLKVPRLGEKAFEQCAGFLRINDGENVLDNSAVHPEAYFVAETIAKDLGLQLHELIKNEKALNAVDYKKYKTEAIGELTIKDIIEELKKPGLDPRAEAQQVEFANIFSIDDVHIGMDVPGVVTNITRFGAFVDIGVKQDGLVHVSEIAHKYITDPNDVLKLNQQVMVKVLEVDKERKRIALSIKQTELVPAKTTYSKPQNKPTVKPKENVDVPIGDALAMLKKKFGK